MATTNETSHNSHYAGFAKRLKAFAFDYLVICGYIILLTGVTMGVVKISGIFGLSLQWPENPVLADLMAFVTLILPVILYFTLQESSPKQATWGKREAGIRVVNINGGRLTRRQAFVRSLVKMVPYCLCPVLQKTSHTFRLGGRILRNSYRLMKKKSKELSR